MELTLLKAKLHLARITHAEIDYEGSCAIDSVLLDSADIKEYEQIDIYNVDNGERFTTYAIRADAHSGIVSLLGAAARKGSVGDRVIICSYARMSEQEAASHKPSILYLDSNNAIATEQPASAQTLRLSRTS